MDITPIKNEDGSETVTLWGKTFDVTDKKKLTAFKRQFNILRHKAEKKKTDKKSTKTEVKVDKDGE